MKLKELGAGIILSAIMAPVAVVFISWASAKIVETGESLGVIEVRVDNVEKNEQRIYNKLDKIDEKIDKILELK